MESQGDYSSKYERLKNLYLNYVKLLTLKIFHVRFQVLTAVFLNVSLLECYAMFPVM